MKIQKCELVNWLILLSLVSLPLMLRYKQKAKVFSRYFKAKPVTIEKIKSNGAAPAKRAATATTVAKTKKKQPLPRKNKTFGTKGAQPKKSTQTINCNNNYLTKGEKSRVL